MSNLISTQTRNDEVILSAFYPISAANAGLTAGVRQLYSVGSKVEVDHSLTCVVDNRLVCILSLRTRCLKVCEFGAPGLTNLSADKFCHLKEQSCAV